MSSPPNTPKPYQSRLFNFVNRHYIKINSQITTKFREWIYVIKGGLQGILMPFVWLWQKTTHINQTFTASEEATANLPPSHCDEIIVTVRKKMIEEDFPLLLTHDFQGLASQIKDHKIVAVLENNRIKDIIPTQKQEEIFLLITSIVKIYEDKQNHSNLIGWIDQLFAQVEAIILGRQLIEEERGLNNYSQENSIDINEEKNFFLPHLIKLAIDYFFGKSKSSYHLNSDKKNNPDSFPSPNQINNLPSSNNQENNQATLSTLKGIVKQSQETIENIIPVVRNVGSQMLNQGLNQVNNIAQNLDNNVTKKDYDPFQIKLIILAALKFFFYQKKYKNYLNSNNKKTINGTFINTELLLREREIEEPWLSWSDLYGGEEDKIAIDNEHLEESKVYYLNENHGESNSLINTLEEETTSLLIEKQEIINHNFQKNHKTLQKKREDSNEVEIEAKIIEMRYEKHFLEVILEKLDQLILWLEELILTVIKTIKNSKLFSGNR